LSLFLRFAAALLALVSLSPATAAPPAKDWSQVAVRTASGSLLQGNPAAPVKLVEYLSLTCPHCGHFEAGAAAPLRDKYIKPGLVSYEVRLALRDPFDLAAAVLARCAGPRAFFAIKPAVFAAQNDWEKKGMDWATTNPDLSKLSAPEAGKTVAKGAGLDVFFAKHGLTPARQAACFADEKEQNLLSTLAKGYWDLPNFPGTPAFTINDVMTPQVVEWPDLDKMLTAAVAKSGHH
jgi:hypothetical protein